LFQPIVLLRAARSAITATAELLVMIRAQQLVTIMRVDRPGPVKNIPNPTFTRGQWLNQGCPGGSIIPTGIRAYPAHC